MTRPAELLWAIAAKLRAAHDETDAPVFAGVRVQLAQYDLEALMQQSAKTPFARVCLLKGSPIPRADAGFDLDLSVAIVVAAGRAGRPDPDFSSADMAALDLMLAATRVLVADPYVGLTQLGAAEFGDQIVVSSDEKGAQGFAIGLCEAKWRLYDVVPARSAVQEAIETGRYPWTPPELTISDGEPEPRLVGDDGGGP